MLYVHNFYFVCFGLRQSGIAEKIEQISADVYDDLNREQYVNCHLYPPLLSLNNSKFQ